MGTTVSYQALMQAIGRELGKQIDIRTTEKDALTQLSADAVTHTTASIATIAGEVMPDVIKNEMCNRLYAYRLELVAANDARVTVLDAEIAEIQRQVTDAGNLSPDTFGVDGDGNVDFDVVQQGILAGLGSNKVTVVSDAEENLSAAQQRALTIDALITLTQTYRPEMIDNPDFLNE